jgi:ADP-heptose:LPS heptosyltransferase
MTSRVARMAVVKPDHVGDLVLSLPNIDFLTTVADQVHLFVSPAVAKIARQLLPHLEIFPIQFSHLSKTEVDESTIESGALGKYDLVLLLREDDILNQQWCQAQNPRSFCVGNEDDAVHETFGQADKIAKIFGSYEVRPYRSDSPVAYPSNIRRVGLSVGSGFPSNQWPWVNWLELGRKLQNRGIEVVLIGGPAETRMLPVLAKLMSVPAGNILIGSSEIEPFLRAVRELDIVIACDSGTGHLCSLATVVVSLQMSGAWQRFSPFGKVHRTLTRDLACAPCLNFHKWKINLCASRECSYLLLPDHVIDALFRPHTVAGKTIRLDPAPMAKLTFGASHMERSGSLFQHWELV